MPTLNPVTIQFPPPAPRPRGLLVDTAVEIPADALSVGGTSRLGRGVQHVPWGQAPLRSGNADCNVDVILVQPPTGDAYSDPDNGVIDDANVEGSGGDYSKIDALQNYDATVEHPAFKLVDGLTCSALSQPFDNQYGDGLDQRVVERMDTFMSAALTRELITGYASVGPDFSDATPLSATTTVTDVATAVEAHLATTLQGGTGMVFLPPQLLHLACRADWVMVGPDGIQTKSGHKVVVDAGHTGADGPAAPGAGELWVFASGTVGYRVSDTHLLGDFRSQTTNIGTNIIERLAEAYAQLAFDPDTVAAVLTQAAI